MSGHSIDDGLEDPLENFIEMEQQEDVAEHLQALQEAFNVYRSSGQPHARRLPNPLSSSSSNTMRRPRIFNPDARAFVPNQPSSTWMASQFLADDDFAISSSHPPLLNIRRQTSQDLSLIDPRLLEPEEEHFIWRKRKPVSEAARRRPGERGRSTGPSSSASVAHGRGRWTLDEPGDLFHAYNDEGNYDPSTSGVAATLHSPRTRRNAWDGEDADLNFDRTTTSPTPISRSVATSYPAISRQRNNVNRSSWSFQPGLGAIDRRPARRQRDRTPDNADSTPDEAMLSPSPKRTPQRLARFGRGARDTFADPRRPNGTASQELPSSRLNTFSRDSLSTASDRARRIDRRGSLPLQGEGMDMDSDDSQPDLTSMRLARASTKTVGSGAILLFRTPADSTGNETSSDGPDPHKAPIQYVPLSFSSERVRNSRSSDSRIPQLPSSYDDADSRVIWPPGQLPSELYAEIASYLSRDDIKAMRLACKEFEKYVSHVLFSTVVVPFNTEIYGMLEADNPAAQFARKPSKGKGRASITEEQLLWKNSKADHLYAHGIDVFRGWGPHITQYGMSFEVDESSLAHPPNKTTQETQRSYWGVFPWPYLEYKRFERTSNLEVAADETPKMKQAFSFLKKVRELALSIDSGLGWLKGPDVSIRTQVLGAPPTVFGLTRSTSDRLSRARTQLWQYLQHQHAVRNIDLRKQTLQQATFNFSDDDFECLVAQHRLTDPDDVLWLSPHLLTESGYFPDDSSLSTVWRDELISRGFMADSGPTTGLRGMLYTAEQCFDGAASKRWPITPNALTKLQKEWLLETEWAQCAFLSSYMIAVIDNPMTFDNVHTLTLARVSSRYLRMLDRSDFWESLPSLNNITIKVLADWRDVRKDPAGFVETPTITPSSAAIRYHHLLENTIARLEPLQHLTIGWACGGEYAEGLYARNKHLLPAPFLPYDFLDGGVNHPSTEAGIVAFPHVEHLTLENSWVTPFALTAFAKKHQKLQLGKLTLESVSLSVPERANNGANQNQQAQPAAMAQLLQNLQAAAAGLPNANGNAAAAAAAAAAAQNVPPPVLPPNLLQQLQNLQAQPGGAGAGGLGQQAAQMFGNAQFFANGGHQAFQNVFHNWMQAQNNGNGNIAITADWRDPPREGSWPWLVDIISPGKNLSDFNLAHSNADNARIAASALAEIELKSCGYAKVFSPFFDNSQLEAPAPHALDAHFQKRHDALSSCMMKSSDPYLGEIVQYMPPAEVSCVQTVWNCTMGWEDVDKADEATFDGAMAGGTGRFTGRIMRRDREELAMDME